MTVELNDRHPVPKTVFGTGSGRAKVDRSDLVNSENENGAGCSEVIGVMDRRDEVDEEYKEGMNADCGDILCCRAENGPPGPG